MALPVVLVHGVRTSRTMWRAQVEALEAAGHLPLAIDLPGHGVRRGERFTLDGAVASVRAGVREVAGASGKALVVGLSLGGYVSLRFAARFPEQVAGVVAAGCSTIPGGPFLRGWALAVRGIERLPDHGARLNQRTVDLALSPRAAADVGAGGFALEVMSDVLAEMVADDPARDLARIAAPVWLVNGQLDHFRADERRLVRAGRDVRLVVVRRATHLVSLVAPVAFSRVLLEAATSLEAATGPEAATSLESVAGRHESR